MFGFTTRWCARRCTGPRHPPNDVACTTRWRRRAIPSSPPTAARGTADSRPPGRTKPWPPTWNARAGRAQEPRRPRRRCGASRASDGADPRPDAPGRARAGRRGGELPGRRVRRRRSGSWRRREAAPLDGFQQARAALLRGHAAVVSRLWQRGGAAAARSCATARAVRPQPRSQGLPDRVECRRHSAPPRRSGRPCRGVPRGPRPPAAAAGPASTRSDDRAFALLITDGHAAAMPVLQRAADEVMQLAVEDVVRWGWHVGGVRTAMWHDEAIAVYERQAQLVREAGALAELPIHLQALALERAWRGDLPGADGWWPRPRASRNQRATRSRRLPGSASWLCRDGTPRPPR